VGGDLGCPGVLGCRLVSGLGCCSGRWHAGPVRAGRGGGVAGRRVLASVCGWASPAGAGACAGPGRVRGDRPGRVSAVRLAGAAGACLRCVFAWCGKAALMAAPLWPAGWGRRCRPAPRPPSRGGAAAGVTGIGGGRAGTAAGGGQRAPVCAGIGGRAGAAPRGRGAAGGCSSGRLPSSALAVMWSYAPVAPPRSGSLGGVEALERRVLGGHRRVLW